MILGLPETNLPPLPPAIGPKLRVLVACEYSGRVRDAFRQRGHDAVSVDLVPCEADPTYHIRGDVLKVIGGGWDLMLAFPPCTYLTSANGARWNQIERERMEALAFVQALMDAPIPRICVENPAGAISSHIRKPDQYIHPWHFGEPYTKRTGLWLKGLPLLRKEHLSRPFTRAWVGGRTNDHVTRNPKHRSRTFQGIARAMAMQWG